MFWLILYCILAIRHRRSSAAAHITGGGPVAVRIRRGKQGGGSKGNPPPPPLQAEVNEQAGTTPIVSVLLAKLETNGGLAVGEVDIGRRWSMALVR